MRIKGLSKGYLSNTDMCYAEVIFEEEETFSIICVEANDLCLLVRTDITMAEICESLDAEENYEYEVLSYYGGEEVNKETVELNLEAIMELCMNSDWEKYECWDYDGGEGICSAAESKVGIAYLIAYDFMQKVFYPYRYFKIDPKKYNEDEMSVSVFAHILEIYEDMDSIEVEELLEEIMQ